MTTTQIAVMACAGVLSIAASLPMLNSYRYEVYNAGWAAAATGLFLILSSAIGIGFASTEATAEEPITLQLLLDADSVEVVPDSNWGRVLGLDPEYAPYILTCNPEREPRRHTHPGADHD